MDDRDEWEDFAPDAPAAASHADPEDREAASRARSGEILSRVPTPEELHEQAARAKANRIAAIMAPDLPPVVVFKRREPKDENGRAGSLTSSRPESAGPAPPLNAHSGGAAPTISAARTAKEERLIEWWSSHIVDLLQRMAKAQMPDVMREFLRELAGMDVASARRLGKSVVDAKKRHRKLKERVKELEQAYKAQTKQTKPVIRVKAGRLPH